MAIKRHFGNLGKDLYDIMLALMEDQDLMKLLYYTSSNPLSESTIDPYELVNSNILIVPRIPAIEIVKNFLIIRFDNFALSNNIYFKSNSIIIDVVCHNNQWIIEGDTLRPFLIMEKIDTIINQSKFNGIGKIGFVHADIVAYTEEYIGYSMVYSNFDSN